MSEEVATEPVNGEEPSGFRSRKSWRDVVAQLKDARERLNALDETVARLADRCAAAEDRAWNAEAELALLGAGLSSAQVGIARRMLSVERPDDIAAWLSNLKEKWTP